LVTLGIVLGVIGCASLGAIGFFRIARRLANPMSDLRETRQMTTTEALTPVIELKRGGDDIGDLGNSFREMTVSIQDSLSKMRAASKRLSSCAQKMGDSSKAVSASAQRVKASSQQVKASSQQTAQDSQKRENHLSIYV